MQARKVRICDKAMQDTGEHTESLPMTELIELFGFVTKDENGVAQVYPDYQDDPESPDNQS